MQRENEINRSFPALEGSGYQITSPQSSEYNCVAWGAGDATRWWWPDVFGIGYWPAGVPRKETISAFVQAFQTLGFEECEGAEVEPGFEKIAFFSAGGRPKHVARQLGDGLLTSKLGTHFDIEHPLNGLEGALYGVVAKVMKRWLGP